MHFCAGLDAVIFKDISLSFSFLFEILMKKMLSVFPSTPFFPGLTTLQADGNMCYPLSGYQQRKF